MKKFLMFLCAVTLVFGMVGSAIAVPINFDVAGASSSSVTISNVSPLWGCVSISAALVDDLDSQVFSLNNGASKTFDFFDITVSECGIGTADISATLAFDTPSGASITGSGNGWFGTFFGVVSAGGLTWGDVPQTYFLPNGNSFDVDFEDICVKGFGNTTTVSATVTAHANPVPEPSTNLLMGVGLLGLVVYSRKRFGKKR